MISTAIAHVSALPTRWQFIIAGSVLGFSIAMGMGMVRDLNLSREANKAKLISFEACVKDTINTKPAEWQMDKIHAYCWRLQ